MLSFETVLLIVVIGVFGYIVLDRYKEKVYFSDIFQKALTKAVEPIQETQDTYIKVLTDLPLRLEAAAARDTHLTKENQLLKERLNTLVEEAGVSAETIVSLTTKFNSLSDDLLQAKADIQKYQQELETLEEAATVSAKTSNIASTDTEFVDSIESVLEALREPTTPYEVGVYNGVVVVANTLIGDDMFEMLDPHTKVIPKPKYNVRGEHGRFVKQQVV